MAENGSSGSELLLLVIACAKNRSRKLRWSNQSRDRARILQVHICRKAVLSQNHRHLRFRDIVEGSDALKAASRPEKQKTFTGAVKMATPSTLKWLRLLTKLQNILKAVAKKEISGFRTRFKL